MRLIGFLIIGLVAGWLAETIMKGRGAGMVVNLVVGVIGAYVGGFIFRLIGLSAHGFIGSLIAATIGSIVLLFIIAALKKA
ncbi:MAG: GlsB/YeaQ/YmgE family stress response membrane protein [Deltaproteobacteria bacterium]|nr:GlsB/YeaQ/YmgE family stress response membrane protein [Deltaproteobacteria bacterium]